MPARSTRSRNSKKVDAKTSLKYKSGRKSAKEDETYASDSEVQDEDDVSDVASLYSDALDEVDAVVETKKAGTKRKRRVSASPKKPVQAKKGKGSAAKKRKVKDDSQAEDSEPELEDGQEVDGVIVQAPRTGRVPPGQISQNTLNFLSELKKPECNDRVWFKLHEPVFRLAESEWKAFVEEFTDVLVEADPQIPHLPPKDVIHRIYRDIRFSNDKTPYKTGFSASFSRSGRKGIFAGYHVAVRPSGDTLIAAGTWCPGKNELATIRSNLQRSSRRLREIISAPDFEALFGPAQRHPKGLRQNIFGMDDELKVAPKGIDKTHKDIDILKCRSFAVVYKFTDKQVLQPEFKEELANIAKIVRPFVHCLNDLMTIQEGSSDDDDDEADEDDGEVD